MEQTSVLFCCIVHFICAESLTQWIWKYKAILCVLSTFYLFMLCDFSFFFMKVPFCQSFSTLGTYSIPHSLLLYSVHVKWILICVQNVIKMKIHLIIYFVHSCGVWWFILINEDFKVWFFPPLLHSRTTCCSWKQASEWGGKVIRVVLSGAWFLVADMRLWIFQTLLIFRDFHAQSSLPFAQGGLKNARYVVGSTSLSKISCWCQWSQRKGQTQGSS